MLVIGWGVLLTVFAIFLDRMRGDINVVNLAFGMVSYTAGPLLGMFLAAIIPWRHSSLHGLTIGFILSFITVLYFRTDLYVTLINFEMMSAETAASFHGVRLAANGGGGGMAESRLAVAGNDDDDPWLWHRLREANGGIWEVTI